MKEILIHDQFITLNQLLKLTDLFHSGGIIKAYIREEGVYVNGELEYRRGRKLYHDDEVELKSGEKFVVKSELAKQTK